MKKFLFTLFLALLILPNSALGATFQAGQSLIVNEPVSDDLYASGGVLSFPSDVNGDLLAAGGKIQVDGKVSQDLMAGAGELTILGEVSDDVRAAAGSLRIATTIKGDLMGAGGDVTLADNSFVGGDARLAGGNILIGGTIGGDLWVAGGTIYLNSIVNGNVTLMNFNQLTFGPNAKILGSFWYRSQEQVQIPDNVVSGTVEFKQIPKSEIKENLPAVLAGFSLFSFLSTLLFGLFMVWLFRYSLLHTASAVNDAALKSLGIGFLVFILTPVVALIFLFTTIGVSMSAVLTALWLILIYVGKITAAALIGFKILRVNEENTFGRIYLGFALGALIYTLIGMVPLVGWIINAVFVLMAMGGFTIYGLDILEQLRKKKLV